MPSREDILLGRALSARGGHPPCWQCPKGGGLFKFETPTGCKNFWGSGGGGGGVGGSGGQPLGSQEGGKWVHQDTNLKMMAMTLIILRIGSGSHQPRSDPEAGSRAQKTFCVFQTVLNSPRNSEYFEHRHIGGKKTVSGRAKKFSAPSALTLSPKISNWRKTGSKTLGGSGKGGRGVWNSRRPPRLQCALSTLLGCPGGTMCSEES